jgi:hypothetical protein
MMKKKRILLSVVLTIGLLLTIGYHVFKWYLTKEMAEQNLRWMQENLDTNSYVPPKGFVPDEATAISIARAVWKSIFGKDIIERNPHQQAVLVDGIWVVECVGELRLGESPHAYVKQETGEILRVYHDL